MRHLKRDVLALLSDGRPRYSWQICEAVQFAEQRAMSTYLRRLEQQGVIQSLHSADAPVLRFQITERGRARLRFFERNPNYDFQCDRIVKIGFAEHHRRRVRVGTPIFRYILGTIQETSNE